MMGDSRRRRRSFASTLLAIPIARWAAQVRLVVMSCDASLTPAARCRVGYVFRRGPIECPFVWRPGASLGGKPAAPGRSMSRERSPDRGCNGFS